MSSKKKSILLQDLQGYTRMLTDATVGITDIAESLHKKIVHPPFLPSTPIQHLVTGISGLVYQSVRVGTKWIGGGLDRAFGLLPDELDQNISSEKRENILASLNGVVGDYLEDSQNPLALSMQIRKDGKAIALDALSIEKAFAAVNGKILLMVHGSCMNDLQWNQNNHNHGIALAEALGLTPVFLLYNSGRHISSNGQELNVLLEKLSECWPCPLEELHILAHSMGGLLSRSAMYYAQKDKSNWIKQLKNIVFLGSPHHGAPLERIGNYIDLLLEAVPYAKPFARLGKIRSAGVTDLRYGNLLDEDWEGVDRFENHRDRRKVVPLPKKVNCFTIAATKSKKEGNWIDQLIGDGLVPLESALGRHKKSDKKLSFKKANSFVVYETNHLDLLSSPEVYEKLTLWLRSS